MHAVLGRKLLGWHVRTKVVTIPSCKCKKEDFRASPPLTTTNGQRIKLKKRNIDKYTWESNIQTRFKNFHCPIACGQRYTPRTRTAHCLCRHDQRRASRASKWFVINFDGSCVLLCKWTRAFLASNALDGGFRWWWVVVVSSRAVKIKLLKCQLGHTDSGRRGGTETSKLRCQKFDGKSRYGKTYSFPF